MANPEKYQAPAEIGRLRTLALGMGGIALIVMAVGATLTPSKPCVRGC